MDTKCILKSNKLFNKNGIIKFVILRLFLCHVAAIFKRNQYGVNSFRRGSLEENFYQIILESDKKIMKESADFKVLVFSSLSDAAATNVLHRMYVFEQF